MINLWLTQFDESDVWYVFGQPTTDEVQFCWEEYFLDRLHGLGTDSNISISIIQYKIIHELFDNVIIIYAWVSMS